MNPAFLLGTAFNIAYWHRKYHSGTICKGVSNPQTSNALSGCEKEEIPKWVWRRYRQRIRMKPKKSLWKMKGKNGILLFVEFLKGLLEDRNLLPTDLEPKSLNLEMIMNEKMSKRRIQITDLQKQEIEEKQERRLLIRLHIFSLILLINLWTKNEN